MTTGGHLGLLPKPRPAADVRRYKRINWRAFIVDRISEHFDSFKAKATADKRFQESLYVYRDPQHTMVQLFFGQHPVGPTPDGKGLAIERGAALVFSQHVTGDVAVFLYPYGSEVARRTEKLIVWAIFDSPDDITKTAITRAISDFLCYSRVSSVLDGGSSRDRRRIEKLVRRDRRNSSKFAETTTARGETAREMKEKRTLNGLVARILAWWPLLLFAFFSAVVTVVSSWDPFTAQIVAWYGDAAKHLGFGHPERVSSGLAGAMVSKTTMPVVAGHYTVCPEKHSPSRPNMMKFLQDVEANARTIAFFDVQIKVDCTLSDHFPVTDRQDWLFAKHKNAVFTGVTRRTSTHSNVTYEFSWGAGEPGGRTLSTEAGWNWKEAMSLVPDNGVVMTINDDTEHRNALTHLEPNAEGEDDIIYGPYLIKSSGQDAFLRLDLTAPTLDSQMVSDASTIDAQRRAAGLLEESPAPNPIPASTVQRVLASKQFSADVTSSTNEHKHNRPPPPLPTSKQLREMGLLPFPTYSSGPQGEAAPSTQ